MVQDSLWMQLILLDPPALLCIALRIFLTAFFIKVKVLIFVLNYILLHLQALELEQSLPLFLPMDYSDQCLAPYYTTFLR